MAEDRKSTMFPLIPPVALWWRHAPSGHYCRSGIGVSRHGSVGSDLPDVADPPGIRPVPGRVAFSLTIQLALG